MGFGQKILKHLGVGSSSRREPHHLYYDTHDTVSAASLTVNNDERDISTDRSNGTYVRLARLSNGIILAAFTWREGGRMDSLRILKISRSLDGGQTFTDFSEIFRGHGEIDNPHILEIASDGDGQHILAAFRNHDFGPNRAGDLAGITHFRITVFESRDAGASWHYLSEAAEKTDGFPLGIWEPFMRMGLQGEVQLIYSHEFAPDDQRTMMVQSFDRGRTWSQPRCIEGAQDRFRDGMTGITETVDTATGQVALVMIFETTRYAPHFNIEAVVSYDDGMTWLHRHQVFTPRRRAHNAGAPQITSFGDGSMAAVFMTDEDAEDVAWVQNAAIKICFGSAPHNGIIRWSEPLTVSPASSFWPGIMAIDARTALVTYEHGGPRGRTVVRS